MQSSAATIERIRANFLEIENERQQLEMAARTAINDCDALAARGRDGWIYFELSTGAISVATSVGGAAVTVATGLTAGAFLAVVSAVAGAGALIVAVKNQLRKISVAKLQEIKRRLLAALKSLGERAARAAKVRRLFDNGVDPSYWHIEQRRTAETAASAYFAGDAKFIRAQYAKLRAAYR